uniref:uncharacterized protein LOC117153224 n=1 Tax=Bombus vancouverensis nearcticus TaxID=2705178 RepID=UPI00143C948B|nr:uncharacterized protein LOC117153224 [Bombus vancouverensis nearcticus]
MYGAPVWADDLMASRRSILLLRRLHRVTAIRIIRGYRTVSHASASTLAAPPPWELRALALKKRYTRRREWHPGEDPTEQAAPNDTGTAEEDTWNLWRSQLINGRSEHRGAEAVLPNWEACRSRHGLPLTFRMTQVITGHGVFAVACSIFCSPYYYFLTCDITERVTLAHPIPGGPVSLAVDASDYAIGAVLHQRVNDKWLPLRFVTTSLTSAQQKNIEHMTANFLLCTPQLNVLDKP